MEQDVEFGLLQIVDIALKAISPAVNDPTTALTCVDQLGRILVGAATREPPRSVLRDSGGRARVTLPRISFPRLVAVAFSVVELPPVQGLPGEDEVESVDPGKQWSQVSLSGGIAARAGQVIRSFV
jgi:hypothetical protein